MSTIASRFLRTAQQALSTAALGLAALTPVHAMPYAEVGDADQLPGSAQSVGGGVTSIVGTLGGGTDIDMYRLTLPGGTFIASTGTLPTCCTGTDTQLFLFDASGHGIVANDDAPSGDTQKSRIEATLVAGTYYLAVSVYDMDPRNAAGFIFPDFQFCCNQPMVGPTGAGGLLPLDGWAVGPSGSSSGAQPGPYEISFNAATVPEPDSLALVALVLAVVAVMRRSSVRKMR